MGRNKKSVFSFCPYLRKLIADFVGKLWCDFPRLKGLAYLIGNHIIGLLSTSYLVVLPLRKHKFSLYRARVTFIGADEFAIIGFIGVLSVISAVRKTLCNTLAFVLVHGDLACGNDNNTSFNAQKRD